MDQTEISNILLALGADHSEVIIYTAVLMGKDTVKQVADERGMSESFVDMKVRKMVSDGLLYISKNQNKEILHPENPGTLKARLEQVYAQRGINEEGGEDIEVTG